MARGILSHPVATPSGCGTRAERFTAAELSDEEKPPILREYLRRWKWEVGAFFGGVGPDSSEAELREIAPNHPIFRVEMR